MRHPTAVDVRGEVVRRYRDGEPPESLAAELALTVRTVRRWLTATGLTEPRRLATDPAVVVAAYAAGEPVRRIASRFAIDDKTVLAMVRRAGEPMRRPRLTDEARVQILARKRNGVAVPTIAAEVGVSRATIYRVLERAPKVY